MTGISTNAADDVRGEVSLLGAIVLAMANLTAVLAGLVFIIAESTVQGSKLSKLIAFELVLPFRDGGGSFDDIVDQLFRLVDFLFGVCHDQAV